MGLDAYVRCRCWSGERPPEPEALRGLIELENDVPTLSIEHTGNEALFLQLREYVAGFCPHDDMMRASERIGSWGYVSTFVAMLREMDAHKFSTLIHIFPDENDGEVGSEALPQLLSELDQLDNLGALGRRLLLVLEDSDTEICSADIDADCVIAVRLGEQQGLDSRCFYVKRGGAVVFQSRHFEQLLQWPAGANAPVAQFRAIDSTQICDGAIAISHDSRADEKGDTVVDYGSRFLIRIAPYQRSDHRLTTESLRRLFQAALETGNPVRWG